MTREGKPYGRRASDHDEHCPQCSVAVAPGKMDTHLYSAHGVDRRKAPEQQTPPPPEKKPQRTQQTTPKDDGGEGRKKRDNVWFRRP